MFVCGDRIEWSAIWVIRHLGGELLAEVVPERHRFAGRDDCIPGEPRPDNRQPLTFNKVVQQWLWEEMNIFGLQVRSLFRGLTPAAPVRG